jgi:hypothetical protein
VPDTLADRTVTLELDDDELVEIIDELVIAEDIDDVSELFDDSKLLDELVEVTPGELSRSVLDEPPPQAVSDRMSKTLAAWVQPKNDMFIKFPLL